MKRSLFAAAASALVLLTGCIVTSVNPLYTGKDLVFDPALAGAWSEGEGKGTWVFAPAGEKSYQLLHTDEEGRTGKFEARLLKLGKYRFLDLHLLDPGEKEEWKINQLAAVAMITRPGHLFFKVSQIEPTLQVSALHEEWLNELLEKDPKAIRHEAIRFGSDSRNVLTASTSELQKFVLKYADSTDAFGDEPGELKRIQKPAAQSPDKK